MMCGGTFEWCIMLNFKIILMIYAKLLIIQAHKYMYLHFAPKIGGAWLLNFP